MRMLFALVALVTVALSAPASAQSYNPDWGPGGNVRVPPMRGRILHAATAITGIVAGTGAICTRRRTAARFATECTERRSPFGSAQRRTGAGLGGVGAMAVPMPS